MLPEHTLSGGRPASSRRTRPVIMTIDKRSGEIGARDAVPLELVVEHREVVRVGVSELAVRRRVGLVVDAAPADAVVAARGDRGADLEDEAALEGDAQQREGLVALGRRQERDARRPGIPSPGVRVLGPLHAVGEVVPDASRARRRREARQRPRQDLVAHRAVARLRARHRRERRAAHGTPTAALPQPPPNALGVERVRQRRCAFFRLSE
mmetsp:Transcript_10570/g.42718  ORF Transcript_10570/g.42718 Transcript_10570/m.42718 type:complete len:210 (+) Transcript_10570:1002-1631(+)